MADSDSSEKEFDDRRRLDAEWCALVALREVLGIALKGVTLPTYLQALTLGEILAPQLFGLDVSAIANEQESTGVREYRQRAAARSQLEGRSVAPLEELEQEIKELADLLAPEVEKDLLQKQLARLYSIRQELKGKRYTEQQAILRDVFKAAREMPVSGYGADYVDFRASDERVLRLRMLHPDPPEHATGADVLYEHYWDKKRMVRLAAIQYKIWKGRTIPMSKRLQKQMDKLRRAFCDNNLCKEFGDSARKEAYRLPYCSAFLRPTDQLQNPKSRLISSGYHIPICVVQKLREKKEGKPSGIASSDFRSEALSHRIFEELFNINMLGSRWMTYSELEKLYREHGILDVDEHIVIHAQEFNS